MSEKVKFYGLWALKILTAAAFLAAGISKLSGAEMMVEVFEKIGVGQWFRYVTGAIEIVGAASLFLPSKAVYGAGLLAATMIGAILAHLFLIGGNPMPAIVLLVLTLVIVWNHRKDLQLTS